MGTPNGQQRYPAPMPDDLRDELARTLPDTLDEDLRWWIERFAEACFARGYGAAYSTGYTAGAAANDRHRRVQTGARRKPVAEREPDPLRDPVREVGDGEQRRVRLELDLDDRPQR